MFVKPDFSFFALVKSQGMALTLLPNLAYSCANFNSLINFKKEIPNRDLNYSQIYFSWPGLASLR
jgi:hypothetical protein